MEVIIQSQPELSELDKLSVNEIYNTAYGVIAPVLCGFVEWTLKNAVKNNITHLHFVARDGYLMLRIAEEILKKRHYPVCCSYLYCSRLSLRLAAINITNRDEVYDMFLEGGVCISPRSLLERLLLSKDERQRVYDEVGFTEDESCTLGKVALREFSDKLKSSGRYNEYLTKIGKEHYDSTVLYLKQCIKNGEKSAIVDSGWMGSVQRVLGKLLASVGYDGKLGGYYLGLFNKQKTDDGVYNTYLFDSGSSSFDVADFNNHLMEAICSAPHGMTVGYKLDGGVAVPVFYSEKSLNSDNPIYEIQNKAVLQYVCDNGDCDVCEKRQQQRRALYALMKKPSAAVAEAYGGLLFSDDVTESRTFPLARRLDKSKRRELLFCRRIAKKILSRHTVSTPVFWSYGSIKLTGKSCGFYRLNAYLWEVLWLIKKKR